MNNKHIELLAPAGDLNRGKIALDFGADAIYLGAKAYSLRARASNFDYEQVAEISKHAHDLNRKIYLVSNIVCHNHMLNGFVDFLNKVMQYKIDGFLCTDPFIIKKIKELYPHVDIHISTQQSVTNSKAALFFARNGAKRIVTAREVSFNELVPMIKNVQGKIEIEIFCHGAVCIAYSGRCMLSSNYCLRDANNGGCAQSCRWVSTLYDEHKKYSDTFSMSAKDMCLINRIKEIIDAGVSAIKIEGRMKSEHYIATIVNAYRKIVNKVYLNDNSDNEEYYNDVLKAANRDTSKAWFDGEPSTFEMLYHEVPKQVSQLFACVINKKINDVTYEVVSRNYFTMDNTFQAIGVKLQHIEEFKMVNIKDQYGNDINVVNTPMSKLTITLDRGLDLLPKDIMRIKVDTINK